MSPLKALLVEDAVTDAELILYELRKGGIEFDARRVDSEQSLLYQLQAFKPDLVISDFSLPHLDGGRALDMVRGVSIDIPFVFVSGTIGEERAFDLMRRGATDYVNKTNLDRLTPIVNRALQETAERKVRKLVEEKLAASERHFRLLVDGVYDYALVLLDAEGKIISWNEGASRLYGYHQAQVIGQHLSLLYEAKHVDRAIRQLGAAVDMGRFEDECLQRRQSGQLFWADAVTTRLDGDGEQPSYFAHIVRDLTERREQEQKIARLNRLYAVLSSINSVIVRCRDRQTLLSEVCHIAVSQGNFALAWVGLCEDGVIEPVAWLGCAEQVLRDVCYHLDDHCAAWQAILQLKPILNNEQHQEDGQATLPANIMAEQGLQSSIALPLVVDGEGIGVLELYSNEPAFFNQDEMRLLLDLAGDIWFALEYISREEKLDYLAFYDALTGLPNRRLCGDRVHQLLSGRVDHHSLAMILLDIERFHFINDTFGRHQGDQLLKAVSYRLASVTDEPDFISRVGTDCFGVVLSAVNSEADVARFLKERMFPLFTKPFTLDDQELLISAKAGVAMAPGDGRDADTLFSSAEAALKKVKATAEPYLFYLPKMQERIAERLAIESGLRRALDEDQFVLYYQPKLDFSTLQIVGLEALIRWQHPEQGMIPPSRFIPILEETGLILKVGEWVLRRALDDAEYLSHQDIKVPRIAVNVSSLQLKQDNFVQVITRLVQARHASVVLDLEITESLLMEDVDININKLEALRHLGVKIMIDDFGTGYSSLSYIARLPIDALKIDRSFVENMTESPNSLSIVTSVISLAHSLNFKVIAEGVETEEQAKFLRLLRCDQVQGFLYGRPEPLHTIADRLIGNALQG
ncbi:diguanylate cyclase (GGDEF)-like protein/PAS domain S-box-containing protein [Chitinivorax tropicus]|uniref:Diguanylate cyclase (GGDEF)-like protein/PAS domain S-box-containing protein n=1 Tax=Chitinivorax tropicus TaxID=714531 RepID=A0A840MMV3_9PROT|nr:EAL domain-containing protein [Chitinivorax tropicus]MBB5018287.1 diguanylate cyclase (GGDEF)-like protein/PAS domain S-box-containing protein [Chitinivorax tropicus]